MSRKYHPWWDWECYKAGFYRTAPPADMTPDEAKSRYRDFLKDTTAFALAMARVEVEWPNSCDQFLTNASINRIAWLGQSAMCITHGVPSVFRGGFKLLSNDEQIAANKAAEDFLKGWLCRHASE